MHDVLLQERPELKGEIKMKKGQPTHSNVSHLVVLRYFGACTPLKLIVAAEITVPFIFSIPPRFEIL